jgi:hypothetical protein
LIFKRPSIWRGLKKLREMLEKYQGILEMMQPDKSEAASAGGLAIL